jgi:hypothetical protein
MIYKSFVSNHRGPKLCICSLEACCCGGALYVGWDRIPGLAGAHCKEVAPDLKPPRCSNNKKN